MKISYLLPRVYFQDKSNLLIDSGTLAITEYYCSGDVMLADQAYGGSENFYQLPNLDVMPKA